MAAQKRPPSKGRSEAPPAFDTELRQSFSLLCVIAGNSCAGKLSARDFEALRGTLSGSGSTKSGAGSGAAGVRHQRTVRSSAAGRPSMNTYLAVLFQADFPIADADEGGAIEFVAFGAWQRSLLQSVEKGFAARKQLISNALNFLEHVSALKIAATAGALKKALHEAAGLLGSSHPVMVAHQARLDRLQAPFSVKLSTLAGGQHEVEVRCNLSVRELRDIASGLVGKKAYRILLATPNARLEPDDATLEACGIKGPGCEIGVAFSAEDEWREMPMSGFLALLEEHSVVTDADMSHIRQRLKDGSLSEDACVMQHAVQLEATRGFERQTAELEMLKQQWKEAEDQAIERFTQVRMHKDKADAVPNQVDSMVAAYQAEISSNSSSVASLEEFCQECALQLSEIKNNAEADLNECVPVLESAVHGLDCLDKRQMSEFKDLAHPPEIIMRVAKAVCLLFDFPPKGGRTELEGYWLAAKADLLSQVCFGIRKLLDYDKDNIDQAIIDKLHGFVTSIVPDDVRKFSEAGTAYCQWVHAMYQYYHVARRLRPKNLALRILGSRMAGAMEILPSRRERLRALQDDLAAIESENQQLDGAKKPKNVSTACGSASSELYKQSENEGLKT